MSKYKVRFGIEIALYPGMEDVDLVDDYGFTEEEAKAIYEDDDKLQDLAIKWSDETYSISAMRLGKSEE